MSKGKRTFQPNIRRRARTHGFRLRMRTRAGRAIVANAEVNGVWTDEIDSRQRIGVKLLDSDGWFAE